MSILAKVIADSMSPQGIRLTTLQLRYPKFIHGEAKTHRVLNISDTAYELLEEVGFMDEKAFSRNASSSRAIPVERLIQDVLDDPAMPIFWGSNKPGMQAGAELDEEGRATAIQRWLSARDIAVEWAKSLHQLGLHKQTVNRIIEPWCHINVVVTATDWNNFFALRCHSAAQPEMRTLAEAIWNASTLSRPTPLASGMWHLPYVSTNEYDNDLIGIKLSVARCARVSYLTQDGKQPNIEDDLKLYDRLVGSEPLHASPAEHQATPDRQHYKTMGGSKWNNPQEHGNFRGWRQYRKMLPNENVSG